MRPKHVGAIWDYNCVCYGCICCLHELNVYAIKMHGITNVKRDAMRLRNLQLQHCDRPRPDSFHFIINCNYVFDG